MTATGRIVVAPGQTIESAAWGNPVWDHSVQCFASAADRTSQFPVPHEGAMTFLEDTHWLYVYAAGDWRVVRGGGVPHQMAAGVVNLHLASNTQDTVAVTFPAGRFSVTPVISLTFEDASGATTGAPWVRTSGTHNSSGMTIVVNKATAIDFVYRVSWLAVQMTTASGPG